MTKPTLRTFRRVERLPGPTTENEHLWAQAYGRVTDRLDAAERLLARWEGGQLHSDALYRETKEFLRV